MLFDTGEGVSLLVIQRVVAYAEDSITWSESAGPIRRIVGPACDIRPHQIRKSSVFMVL